jgi:hypothetical protein
MIYRDNPGIDKISYMLWLSQVFENVNIADTLEKSAVLNSIKNTEFMNKKRQSCEALP